MKSKLISMRLNPEKLADKKASEILSALPTRRKSEYIRNVIIAYNDFDCLIVLMKQALLEALDEREAKQAERRTMKTEVLMIILNHCKELSEIIHYVLHKKSLPPILYTEIRRVESKYCETVLHSLQQHMNCVIHSGCLNEITLYFKEYSLRMETNFEYRSPRHLFFQPVPDQLSICQEKIKKNKILDDNQYLLHLSGFIQ